MYGRYVFLLVYLVLFVDTTVDASEIRQTHQLRLVVYPIIYN